jgi:hypothetical protein
MSVAGLKNQEGLGAVTGIGRVFFCPSNDRTVTGVAGSDQSHVNPIVVTFPQNMRELIVRH